MPHRHQSTHRSLQTVPPLYDTIGIGYATHRQPDPRIAARIADALRDARSVVNVGAGAGSYEPADTRVVAVEPSAEMIRQRPAGSAPPVRGVAERLPLRDRSVDAAMAVLTLHHWPDWRAGIREMTRVARDRIVIFTWEDEHPPFWLVADYFPEILEIDRGTFPAVRTIASLLPGAVVRPVPIPADCRDGFLGAYWRRPEAYLDARVRRAISVFARLTDVESGLRRLRADLASGRWYERNRAILGRDDLDIGYRLIVAPVDGPPSAGKESDSV